MNKLDSGFRRNDGERTFKTFYESVKDESEISQSPRSFEMLFLLI
jgi:hypothetical protein